MTTSYSIDSRGPYWLRRSWFVVMVFLSWLKLLSWLVCAAFYKGL